MQLSEVMEFYIFIGVWLTSVSAFVKADQTVHQRVHLISCVLLSDHYTSIKCLQKKKKKVFNK